MKLLIIGAEGQVGGVFMRAFGAAAGFSAVGTARNGQNGFVRLDLNIPETIIGAFEKIRPDAAVLCSALTDVDACESDPDSALAVNGAGAALTARACGRFGSKLVYISTEYIFDGREGPYAEEAASNPINVYGASKLAGEKAVSENEDCLIIRTAGVYSYDKRSKNFAMQLINRLEKGERMNVPADQYSTPTYAPDIAEAAVRLLNLKKNGIYNVAGADFINRYEFAVFAARQLGLNDKLITPKKTPELAQKASRPLRAGLEIFKLERETGFKPCGAERGIAKVKEDWKRDDFHESNSGASGI